MSFLFAVQRQAFADGKLKNQNDELWETKKQNVLQQGEVASSKLLIPIMIMFVGILIMVMGPIMTNLGI